MTPAETLASVRPIKRPPRNLKPYTRKVSWVCHCRTIREGLKLSFDEVVRALKISRTAYWQIEKGGDPMLTTATKIATFYGKEIKELWTPITTGKTTKANCGTTKTRMSAGSAGAKAGE